MTFHSARLKLATFRGLRSVSKAGVLLVLCFALAVVSRAVQPTAVSSALIPIQSRKPAPQFTLPDLDGKSISLGTYRGRVVLLDFWAVNCGGCKLEIPWYVEFSNRYQDKGLSLIGLDMYGESPDVIKPFLHSARIDYPIAVGSDALGAQYGLREMPLTILIDREGRIAEAHAGVVDKAHFENDIKHLLSE